MSVDSEPFWNEARWQGACACRDCDENQSSWDAHHAIHWQHVKLWAPTRRWDPRNALRMSNGGHKGGGCHGRHHSGQRKIKVSELLDVNLEFAAEIMGSDRAVGYFQRYYDDDGDLAARITLVAAGMVR